MLEKILSRWPHTGAAPDYYDCHSDIEAFILFNPLADTKVEYPNGRPEENKNRVGEECGEISSPALHRRIVRAFE